MKDWRYLGAVVNWWSARICKASPRMLNEYPARARIVSENPCGGGRRSDSVSMRLGK